MYGAGVCWCVRGCCRVCVYVCVERSSVVRRSVGRLVVVVVVHSAECVRECGRKAERMLLKWQARVLAAHQSAAIVAADTRSADELSRRDTKCSPRRGEGVTRRRRPKPKRVGRGGAASVE